MLKQEITLHARLIASSMDGMGYINYVFEDLEFKDFDCKYIMCVQFPNWNQGLIKEGDVGYVTIKYVREGVDEWFDGKEFVKYKYTNIIFLKFIKEQPYIDNNIIID